MKQQDEWCVPPGKAHFPDYFCIGKKIPLAGSEEAVVYQGMGTKGVLPKRHVHEILVQRPFEEACVNKETEESGRLADENDH